MQTGSAWLKRPDHSVAVWLTVAVVYFALGVVALNWAVIQENTAVLWPASGFAIAAVFYYGYGVWPGVFAGAAAVVLTTSVPVAAALLIGLGNTLEALVGVWLFRRLAGSGEPLEDLRKTVRFIVTPVLAGPLISAGFGALALFHFVGVPFEALLRVAPTWWLGNVAGVLVLAPLLLSWWPFRQERTARGGPIEAVGLLLLMTAVASIAFGLWGALPARNYPLAYLPFPVLAWAAVRFGQRGGTGAMLLLTVIATSATSQGLGPFGRDSLIETFWLLIVYLVVSAATVLCVTAIIRERDSQRRELAEARDHLDTKVTERTRELRLANQALKESEARLRMVVTEAPVILWCLDAAGRFSLIQGQGLEALGIAPEAMLGRTVADVFPDNPRLAANCAQVLQGQAVKVAVPLGGRVFELHALPLHRNGMVAGAIGVCLDVTDRARAEEKSKLAATVFASTTEGVMITDAEGTIIAVNAAFSEITGYDETEALGRNPRILKSNRHGHEFYADMWKTLKDVGRWQGEIWNRRKDGEIYPEWLTLSVVRDEKGRASHYVGVFSDISSIKLSQAQLDFLAHHDPLTGLANRLLFNERLEHAVRRAERDQRRLAVLFLDLDHFKHVNDSLGHATGDELLVQVAGRLREAIRGDDTVARVGGDEFVILAEGVHSPEEVVVIANKLLEACRHPFQIAERELYLGMSIGISLYPEDGHDAEHLIKNADAALYLAKREGRNVFRFYTGELTRRALERVEFEVELRRALEAGEFELHYQPQFCLVTGRVLAVEALLRWRHPLRGLLYPGDFLAVAEECGLIVPIGAWVLEEACRQMAAWLEAGYALEHLAVNVSGIQVERDGLEAAVKAALGKSGLSPYFLELEITEGALALERAETSLKQIKNLGLRLAVDDFGTGFSSLSYLKHLPLDGLKIDRKFVSGGEADAGNTAIVESILALGHGLGLTVVAEGAEDAAQVAWLKRLGCDAVQGYHTCLPLPAAELVQYLVRDPGG